MVVIQHLSTRLIKPNFCFDLPLFWLIGRPVRFAVVSKTSDISLVHILIKGKCWEFTFGTDDTLNFENIMLLCLIVDQESFFLSPRLIWITVNGHEHRCARINFTKPMLKPSFNRSGSIVRYDALAPRPEVLLHWYFVGACTVTLELKFFPYSWRKYQMSFTGASFFNKG